jgi:hypothetical protein
VHHVNKYLIREWLTLLHKLLHRVSSI